MKASTIILGAAIALALLAILNLGSCLFRPVAHGQANRIFEKTVDADNVIYNYEWFKTQYQEIQSLERKVAIAQQSISLFEASAGPRDSWDFRTRDEAFRLNSNLSGVRNVRSDAIAEYNARARMANRSIFMGRDVPETYGASWSDSIAEWKNRVRNRNLTLVHEA